MSVKLLFTLICDDVRIEKSNKLIIVGLYNYTINFKAPSQRERGTEQAPQFGIALPFLTILRRWQIEDLGYTATTELHDPTGKVMKLKDIDLVKPTESEFFQDIAQVTGIVLVPGKYKIRTVVNTAPPQWYEEHFLVTAFD